MDREFIPEGLKDLGRFGASRIVRAWAKQNQLHVRKDINIYSRSYDAYTFIYSFKHVSSTRASERLR